jgi:hypothetical protein
MNDYFLPLAAAFLAGAFGAAAFFAAGFFAAGLAAGFAAAFLATAFLGAAFFAAGAALAAALAAGLAAGLAATFFATAFALFMGFPWQHRISAAPALPHSSTTTTKPQTSQRSLSPFFAFAMRLSLLRGYGIALRYRVSAITDFLYTENEEKFKMFSILNTHES